jgi:hypothetical protein
MTDEFEPVEKSAAVRAMAEDVAHSRRRQSLMNSGHDPLNGK